MTQQTVYSSAQKTRLAKMDHVKAANSVRRDIEALLAAYDVDYAALNRLREDREELETDLAAARVHREEAQAEHDKRKTADTLAVLEEARAQVGRCQQWFAVWIEQRGKEWETLEGLSLYKRDAADVVNAMRDLITDCEYRPAWAVLRERNPGRFRLIFRSPWASHIELVGTVDATGKPVKAELFSQESTGEFWRVPLYKSQTEALVRFCQIINPTSPRLY